MTTFRAEIGRWGPAQGQMGTMPAGVT
jgi:hypothetical protein